MKEKVRLGIIGTGRIADRMVRETEFVSYVQLTAVYNPHRDSAKRFASEHENLKASDQWEDFLTRVDAVYIASPHGTHYDYAKSLLTAGKHVICEKPMVLKEKQAEELFGLAEQKDLILMEAMKTAYCPGFLELEETVRSGIIGDTAEVEAAFTRLTTSDTREYTDLRYGGSFTEFGSYPLLPIFRFLGTDFRSVQFISLQAPNGVDGFTKAIFCFDGKTASAKTGLTVKSEGQLLISGSKGYILVPSPWWLMKKFEIRFEDPGRIIKKEFKFEGSGLRYELRAFVDRIKEQKIIETGSSLTEKREAVARADVMERFLSKRDISDFSEQELKSVRIWAHRGCSCRYPENTLPAFEAAAKLPGITGIELDVQRSADGEAVVIHDETVERVTEGSGFVKDLSFKELQELPIKIDLASDYDGEMPAVPSLRQVLTVLSPYCREKGLKINIELKTGVVRYEGLEEQVCRLVKEAGLQQYVVYSSFLADSIRIIKELEPEAETGMLASMLSDCRKKGDPVGCDAYHPWVGGLTDIPYSVWDQLRSSRKAVRAWNASEPLYGSGRRYKEYDLREYGRWGVTDIFTNLPERYLPDFE